MQKKTHLKLYQNKRSLAYLHRNFDTIKVAVHFYAQMPKQRNLWELKETIAFMAALKKSVKIMKSGVHTGYECQKENDSKVTVDFCNETWRFRVHFWKVRRIGENSMLKNVSYIRTVSEGRNWRNLQIFLHKVQIPLSQGDNVLQF